MAFAIKWDEAGERFYQNGVDRGVLYVENGDGYDDGVAWNGLTSVQATPSGGEANPFYADNLKYLNLYSLEENGATIEAYTYPDAFEACDGSALVTGTTGLMARAQERKQFGFTWRSKIGNDKTEDAGYIIHIMYGCKASPSERQYQTINDSPEPITLSWEITTIAPDISLDGFRNTSLFEVDTRKFGTDKTILTALEEKLYGVADDNSKKPTLPKVEDLINLMKGQNNG